MAVYNSTHTGTQIDSILDSAFLKSEAQTLSSTIDSTYLKITDAANNYLTKTEANNIYLNISNLSKKTVELQNYSSCEAAYAALKNHEHGFAQVQNGSDTPTIGTYQIETWRDSAEFGWQTARITNQPEIWQRSMYYGTWSRWFQFRKNSENSSTVSYRAAMGQDQSVTTGICAFLDNYVHATLRTSANYGKTVLGFGTAGPNFGCVVMFHATGNYYGGIAWTYSGQFVKFGYLSGTFYIWNW